MHTGRSKNSRFGVYALTEVRMPL